MDPLEEYRPDPPAGLGYSDFRAARGRYLARVSGEAEIARLERALALPFPGQFEQAEKPLGGSEHSDAKLQGFGDEHRSSPDE